MPSRFRYGRHEPVSRRVAAARWALAATIVIGWLVCGREAQAGPSVTSFTGSWTHGATVTITGAGFGTKSKPGPVIWDDAKGSDIRNLWDGAWPSARVPGTSCATAGDPQFNTNYRAVGHRSINGPHPFATHFIAGAHGEQLGFCTGYDVLFWKTRTVSFPTYSYISYYRRFDDKWVADPNSDRNMKEYDWSRGGSPYTLPQNWYAGWTVKGPSGKNCASVANAGIGINDDAVGKPEQSLEGGGKSVWDANSNPFLCKWVKVEYEIKWTNQKGGGFVRIFEDGRQVMDYVGKTDGLNGNQRAETIGGYARDDGNPNNWRYYADVYVDYTLQRVALCSGATWKNRGVCELQRANAWSDGSITVTVNQASFASGASAYLYVVDASGTPSDAISVTIGDAGGGSDGPPNVSNHVRTDTGP